MKDGDLGGDDLFDATAAEELRARWFPRHMVYRHVSWRMLLQTCGENMGNGAMWKMEYRVEAGYYPYGKGARCDRHGELFELS